MAEEYPSIADYALIGDCHAAALVSRQGSIDWCCFSCKTQVSELTDRRPLHLAQVVRMAAEHGPKGPAWNYPERGYPDVVPAKLPRRRSG